MVVIVNVSDINEISKAEAKDLMMNVTGGLVEEGPEKRLSASDKDQSYLPVR